MLEDDHYNKITFKKEEKKKPVTDKVWVFYLMMINYYLNKKNIKLSLLLF